MVSHTDDVGGAEIQSVPFVAARADCGCSAGCRRCGGQQTDAIRDTSLQAYGKVKFMAGKPKMVGIAMSDAEWDGCYVFSSEDEAALKYVPG